MRSANQPVYMIGVASELCGVHPQTLRQYERLGLVVPARVGAKNRLYSEEDILRVRQIQRLTQDMGVNLAGVEIILRLLDEMDEMKDDMEKQMADYVRQVEQVVAEQFGSPSAPIRKDGIFLPVPKPKIKPRDGI
jgi:MerR family transcriptional regulator/heat shock protein HspR